MVVIGSKQLAILCACHFIAHFDYADLLSSVYRSDYETKLEDLGFLLWCEVHFNEGLSAVTDFHYGILPLSGNYTDVEVLGEKYSAMALAIRFINSYLTEYKIAKTDGRE
ncbi:MAG: hypothetical protein IJ338_06240 [Bacteroidaceae bacterium]|nr:hypothetical protein [Bacteroidaceae bacterium]